MKSILKKIFLGSPLGSNSGLRKLERAVWFARFHHWCKAHPCKAYPSREDLYQHMMTQEGLSDAIDYLEFGVWEGRSIKWWLDHNDNPDSRFIGFDTFTGLPEQWEFGNKGQFSTDGKSPEVEDGRCSFEAGLFQDTLPPFQELFNPRNRLVVNLDADLYSSTIYVLLKLSHWLKSGDIHLFDEMFSFEHEFRAFCHFLEAIPMEYEVLGSNYKYRVVAIKLGERKSVL